MIDNLYTKINMYTSFTVPLFIRVTYLTVNAYIFSKIKYTSMKFTHTHTHTPTQTNKHTHTHTHTRSIRAGRSAHFYEPNLCSDGQRNYRY